MLKKILVPAVLAVLLSACGGAPASKTAINVEMTDFAYTPSSSTITAGQPVTITLENKGLVEHDFVVSKIDVTDVSEGSGGMDMGHDMNNMGHDMGGAEYDLHVSIPSGESNTITFTSKSAGVYQFFCTVPGHKEAGMIGELTIVEEN